MNDTLNTIIQAIKLLENQKADAAEFILRQEVKNIQRKYLMGIICSKDVMGNNDIKDLFEEFTKYIDNDPP